jgi:hypothetical protein
VRLLIQQQPVPIFKVHLADFFLSKPRAVNGISLLTVGLLRLLEQGCQIKPKIQIWVKLEFLAMEDVGIFYRHLIYFTSIWYILWLFGTFGYVIPIKIWQLCVGVKEKCLGVCFCKRGSGFESNLVGRFL